MKYPETKEERKAGMAQFRARMLAAHKRELASGRLKPSDAEYTRSLIATIEAAQKKFD